MSKGRILIVTYVFPPEEEGVGMAAYEMACSLSSLNWDIHVLTRPLDFTGGAFPLPPIQPSHNPAGHPDEGQRPFKRIPERVFERFPAGCYHLPLLGGLVPGRIAGRGAGFRHSVFPPLPWNSYQLPLFFHLNHPPFFGLKKWLCSFFQIRRDILNVCRKSPLNRLVFLDPYGTLFKSFDYYCASRRKLAHYSCIPNTFPALKRTAPFFREKYGLSSAPVFTCPASASMRKRQLLFIRHVKRTHLQQITFLFLIPQRNSYAEQMEQAIGDDPRFRILYRLPRPEVEAAITESNAVFLYSFQEQQPLSILEAMSCGVPWFAPDAGALSTLEGGIVLKNASPSALEKAVESLTDETTRETLGRKGLRQWEARYAPDAVNQEWEQLLFSSIRPEGKPPFASSIVREHLPTC